jgi:hypothetical protein
MSLVTLNFIWYEILSVVNLISKHVQAKDMLIDVAIKSGDNSDIDCKVLHVELKFLQEGNISDANQGVRANQLTKVAKNSSIYFIAFLHFIKFQVQIHHMLRDKKRKF